MKDYSYIYEKTFTFQEKALKVFDSQSKYNPIYRRFCDALGIDGVESVTEIPLLPIEAFKEAEVITAEENSQFTIYNSQFFQSSGTSRMQRSRHYLKDPEIYRQSIIHGMQHFYELNDYVIWAYTPGYNDNPHSSLVWMLNTLIEREESGLSKYLELEQPLDEHELQRIQQSGKKLMLFGAAFGLMDLLEEYSIQLPEDSIILETGGMKTHRREISKEALHQQFATRFGLPLSNIHSEYGMTELLSQAYAQGSLWFEPVPWMKVTIRDPKNPMKEVVTGEEGVIGIIDLANIYSCSFLLTGDKGIQREDGKFQVLGRWNPKNLRGCNFLIDQD